MGGAIIHSIDLHEDSHDETQCSQLTSMVRSNSGYGAMISSIARSYVNLTLAVGKGSSSAVVMAGWSLDQEWGWLLNIEPLFTCIHSTKAVKSPLGPP